MSDKRDYDTFQAARKAAKDSADQAASNAKATQDAANRNKKAGK